MSFSAGKPCKPHVIEYQKVFIGQYNVGNMFNQGTVQITNNKTKNTHT